jgi:hypothetical protein
MLCKAKGDNVMANINLKKDREAKLKAIARQNDISLSFLMQKIADAFLANPTIFLQQFTIESENSVTKQIMPTPSPVLLEA